MAATVWSGYITFGLVSFPVKLYSAARPEAVHFHLLHRKDLSRLKEVFYCDQEDKPVERSEIVKGYEVKKGEYVVVTDEELKKIAPATASTMDILQFVKSAEVDPIYFEHSYYVGVGDNLGKPYSLFLKALEQTKSSAIAKLTMHGRENVVLIRATSEGLLLHTLFYPNELKVEHRPSLNTEKSGASKKELDLAVKLVEQLAGPFNPEQYHDTYREQVERLIEQKQKGETITAEPKPRRAPVIDLMQALQKSLKRGAVSSKAGGSKSGRARAQHHGTSSGKGSRRRKVA